MKQFSLFVLLLSASVCFSQTKKDTISQTSKSEKTIPIIESKEQKRERIIQAMRTRSERAKKMLNRSKVSDTLQPKTSDKETFNKVFQSKS